MSTSDDDSRHGEGCCGDDPASTSTPQDRLLDALLSGRLEEFCQLLKNKSVKANYKYGKPHFASCLEIACRRINRGDFVEALLKVGKVRPYVNTIIPEPIHYTAKVGAHEALRHLLQHKKTDVNAVDSKGYTALHYIASNYKETEDHRYRLCLELLLARYDVDINKPNKNGFTPIHQAVSCGKKELVKLLLKHRKEELDLDSVLATGRNARTLLIQKFPDLYHSLPEIKYSNFMGNESQILVAFQNRHLEVFCGLLRQVDREGNPLFDPNYVYGRPFNCTCLELACSQSACKEFLEELLKAGADPNKPTKDTFKGPIHIAAEALNYDALEVLLARSDINANAVDKEGWTALHYAAASTPVEENELSDKQSQTSTDELENLVSPTSKTSNSNAVFRNSQASSGYIESSANQTIGSSNSEKPDNLEKCIRLLHDKITTSIDVKELINLANARKNKKAVMILKTLESRQSKSGSSLRDKLFEHIYKQQSEEFITNFKEAMKEDHDLLRCKDSSGNTLLQIAVASDLLDVVEILLKNGADSNFCRNRRPPIVTATKQQNLSILKLLLNERNINVDITDMKGDTALHHAVRLENLECTVALLNSGADIRKENVLGNTPLCLKGLKGLLDKSLMTNKQYYPQHEDYEVIFDYTLLTATKCDPAFGHCKVSYNSPSSVAIKVETTGRHENRNLLNGNDPFRKELKAETELLHYISVNYRTYRPLLDHPVISSFLQFKWDCVKVFFYINLVFFCLYFLVLNLFIMLDPHNVCIIRKDLPQNITSSSESTEVEKYFFSVVKYFLILLTVPLSVRELLQFFISPWRYAWNWENYLDLTILSLTWVIISKVFEDCVRVRFDVAVILLSCVELIMMIGRHPLLSRNIEMLKAVSKSYIRFLSSYIFLILAFSHCIYIVFRENMIKHDIPRIVWAFCRSIIFMTGEFDANDLHFSHLPYTTVIVFLLFVFFISMVLLNLLIGLSVNDTKAIYDKSAVLAINSRIHVVYEIETIVLQWYKTCRKCCLRLEYLNRWFKYVILFQNKPHQKRVTTLPNREGSIKDHPFGKGVKVDNNILEEALRMISRCQQSKNRNDTDQQIDLLEKSVLDILSVLKENYSGNIRTEED